MPSVVTSTLNFAVNSRVLYASTYGRSIYKISVPAVSFAVNNSSAENSIITSAITVYPNPASGYSTIKLAENKKGTIIKLYNNAGNVVLQDRIQANVLQEKINVQNITPGNYTLLCNDGQHKTSLQLTVAR
jgi:hypothetical protein